MHLQNGYSSDVYHRIFQLLTVTLSTRAFDTSIFVGLRCWHLQLSHLRFVGQFRRRTFVCPQPHPLNSAPEHVSESVCARLFRIHWLSPLVPFIPTFLSRNTNVIPPHKMSNSWRKPDLIYSVVSALSDLLSTAIGGVKS